MFLAQHYQNAYVTPDIDRAVTLLREQFGAQERVVRIDVTQPVWTPAGRGDCSVKLAFLQVGPLQYEIIEPVGGLDGLYREAVMADHPLRFHHVAMRVDDIDTIRRESERLGRKAVYAGEGSTVRFLYVDARDTLGHYLEYVQAPPAFWDAMKAGG
ncbi:MAG: VOC family protein [Dongiaceae bacterium]